VLLGAAAASAGVAAGVAGRAAPASAAAASPAPVLLGKANTETATTSISNAKGTALSATTTRERKSAVAGTDASTGGGTGVTGTSTNGTGVAGTSTHSFAVWGTSTHSVGVYAASTNGTGVAAVSTNGSGIAGTTSGDSQSGVAGSDESTGGGYGVFGSSTNGTGVAGLSTNGTGIAGTTNGNGQDGVSGTDTSPDGGNGVSGTAANGIGVFGSATNGTGVWAFAANGTALYAEGDATVTGSLSKGGGSFKIDHPLDPAAKYLYHSFVESPDMMNIYNSTVTLDGQGRATVALPDWFGALNRDYRYQLTPIGGPAPDLHIAAEVSGGQFAIGGGAAGQKVSWQVTGIRQDAWANANRIPVEEDKPAEDQGRYLHPDLHHGEPITSIARAHAHAARHRSARTATPRPHHQATGGAPQ
jgi:hypothetical protein